LSVVVVFATPPFWLVNAMTLALGVVVTGSSGSSPLRKRYSHGLGGILHPSRPVPSLLDKRLVLVTGKGGVGKTTVAAALGLAAARRGKRTVVCEVAEQKRIPPLFSSGDADGETEIAPGLFAISVDPERAKEEWLRYQLKSRTLAGVLGGSRLFQYLTAAAPGLSELVTIGKVWDLAQLERRTGGSAFDLAIVDAPATGNALAMLTSPRTFASVARLGPVGRQAEKIDRFLRDDASTGVLMTALPEEMPVNETIEFERSLRDELGIGVDRIVVNALHPARFSREEVRRIEAAQADTAVARAALAAALSEHRRARAEHAQLRRLRRGASAPVVTLPRVFESELGRDDLERLSRELERRL
jgi:anion-transporting  ArsA/GET3 family ATPase